MPDAPPLKILMTNPESFIPQSTGGTQSSTDEIIRELRALGHDVWLLARLWGEGWLGLRGRIAIKLNPSRTARDRMLGYDTYRAWQPETIAARLVARRRPDVAVLPTSQVVPMARVLQDAGVPLVIYLRDVEFDNLRGDLRTLRNVRYIANSRFTAQAYRAAFGIESTIVPPLFQPERYRTNGKGHAVTFINPHRSKGVDIALALVERCPDIPFQFIEGWSLSSEDDKALRAFVARLPNVKLLPRTRNMAAIYASTKILLVPSRWEEGWGRVVSEAQFSGIPVLASARGGLPESVGPGGILVDIDAPIERWVEALRRMWDDQAVYDDLSAHALSHAGRPELNKAHQIQQILDVLREAAQKG